MPLILPGNVASATAAGYDVDNSCRFNGSDSYMHWTDTGGSGSRVQFSISLWCKKCSNGVFNPLVLGYQDGNNFTNLQFNASDQLQWYNETGNQIKGNLITNRLFRDPSAWYHILAVWDSGNGTAGNRMRLYVNGTEETSFATDANPDADEEAWFNYQDKKVHLGYDTGDLGWAGSALAFNGYIAQFMLVDGTVLTPSDVGEFDSDSPTIWKPIDISSTSVGTNGAFLDFADSDNLGDNEGIAGEDWTEVNLAAADQMVDTPTNNFPTASPIFEWYYTANIAMAALSEGNLKSNPTSNQVQFCKVPFDMTGKVYFEAMPITQGYQVMGFGETLCAGASDTTDGNAGNYKDGINIYVNAGTEYLSICVNGSYSNDGGDNVSISAEDIVQFAYDADTGKAWLGVNNTWHDSGDPANGTNPICTFPASTRDNMHPCGSGYGAGDAFVWNFGQNSSFAGVKTAQGNQDGNDIGDFYYAPPSGFLALCSKNRSDTTINDPEAYFQTKIYTGDGSTPSITLDGDMDMQPDVVWIKNRDELDSHCWFDSVRGATKLLYPDTTDDEEDDADTLTSFDSDGFALGADVKVNTDTEAYVAWCWKESATAGFDIVAYQGTGSTRTISHNLSAVPHCILIMPRTNAGYGKSMYHHKNTAAPETDVLVLNTTAATSDNADYWNDTAPTSSVFTLDTLEAVNENGGTRYYIAYLWSEKQGFSAMGSFEGNGSTTATGGPFIYTGFSPSFVIIKSSSATANWEMFDNKRIVAGYPAELHPHADATESVPPGDRRLLFKSNGFKIDTTLTTPVNVSGDTYIYMAFAEAPFVNSNGVPCNAR